MRSYAKVGPTFWTGATGKALRRRGIEGADYLAGGASQWLRMIRIAPYLRFVRNVIRWRSVELAKWALEYELNEAARL